MKLCTEPWSTITVANNGEVKPCLCPHWHRVGVIGNLLRQSLQEVMTSDVLKKFQQRILGGDYSYCENSCAYKDHVTDKDPDVIKKLNLPKKIVLAIDKNCNLACGSCRIKNVFSSKPDKNAEVILNRLYDSYREKEVEIQFDGLGDLFASKAYNNFLQKKFGSNVKFHIITNGNLLTKNEKLINKIKDNILSIDVSLDAANSKTYKEVRGGVFNLVKDGIKMCTSLGIKTNLSFVVQAKNYKELTKFWEIGVQLGCGQTMFHMIRRWHHMTDKYWIQNSVEHLPKSAREVLAEQLTFLKKTKLKIREDSIPVNMTGDLWNFKP